jgi:hypothetical protein
MATLEENMTIRPYDRDRDEKAVHRIWHEVGWIEKDKTEAMDLLLGCSRPMVAEHDGAAECLVLATSAQVRHLNTDLPATAITGVTTSLVARRQGLAGRTLAVVLAHEAQAGAALAGLGIFDQGYYDRLGFGTGSYEPYIQFDPSNLNVPIPARPPRRLEIADWEALHASRLTRWRGHGAWTLLPTDLTKSQALETENGIGLGFRDGPEGALSHWLWLGTSSREHGPYGVHALVFRDGRDLLELLGVLKSLADQIYRIDMTEPFCLQIQDLLSEPFANRQRTQNGKMAQAMRAAAWWQIRILDLPTCVRAVHGRGPAVRCNLTLTDPVARYLDQAAEWRGLTGEYTLCVAEESSIQPEHTPGLPELRASVGAFSRLWLGVRSATSLAISDSLDGEPQLLAALDRTLALPTPRVDWGF